MSNLLNTLTIENAYGKTGVQSVFLNPKEIVGAIIVPKGWKADATYMGVNGASFLTSLQADTLKAIGSRIFPVFAFGGIEDKSEAPKYQTFGYGSKRKSSDGIYTWSFPLMSGGVNLISELRKFSNTDYDVLFVDRENVILGTSTGVAGEMTGISTDYIEAMPWKAADGSNAVGCSIEFGMSLAATKQMNEDLMYVKCDFDVEKSVLGIIGVELAQAKAAIATACYISAKTNENSIDLYDLFATELTAAGAWIMTKADGTAATLTVTNDPVNKHFILTPSVSLTKTTVRVQLQTPAALAALHVGGAPENGLESNIISVTFA